jgi:5-methylcytosine-specific restriction endonuclease McrA
MKDHIKDISLMKGFEQYSTNAKFLGVESIEEFQTKEFNDSVIETDFGFIKPSRTVKVIHSDGYKCVQCKKEARYVTYQQSNDNGQIYVYFWVKKPNCYVPLTKDHIHAKSLGGTDAYDNLQSLCYLCNQEKSDDIVLPNDGSETRPRKVLDAEVYKDYKKKIADFKYLRKRIKRMMKTMPWYFRILGVDKYFEKKVIELMRKKGYFVDDE